MQQLNDLLREWRVVDAKAASAERAVQQASEAQQEGRGLGPTPSQLARAKVLRDTANSLLTQYRGRAKTMPGHAGPCRSGASPAPARPRETETKSSSATRPTAADPRKH